MTKLRDTSGPPSAGLTVTADSAGEDVPASEIRYTEDRYTIGTELGRGGMGRVTAAYDNELDRSVAIKVLHHQGSDNNRQLLEEARAMARLSHPNIVTIYDVDQREGQIAIVMELVEGQTLASWLEERPRDWKEIVAHFCQAGRGLMAAHEAGLVHRDFKPQNVLVGSDGRVLVADFGVASVSSFVSNAAGLDGNSPMLSSAVGAGRLVGTPIFMAPEQHRAGTVDARADQFSFCVSLFRALHGTTPFAGGNYDELARSVIAGELQRPQSDTKIPAPIQAVLVRGLQSEPENRFPSMEELLGVLSQSATPKLRARWPLALGGVVLVGLLGTTALYSQKRNSREACPNPADRLAAIWDASVKDSVERSFLATNSPFAAETFTRVAAHLDKYASTWVRERQDACRATHVRKEQSPRQLDVRMECLDRSRRRLRALTALLASNEDPAMIPRATTAALRLPDLSECTRSDKPGDHPKGPGKDNVPDEVATLLDRLDVLRVQETAGLYSQALAAAEEIATRARQLEYAPLLAPALHWLGLLQARASQTENAEKSLRESIVVAASYADDMQAAASWVELANVTGLERAKIKQGFALVAAARTAIARAGSPDRFEARLLTREGLLHKANGDLPVALEKMTQALVLREANRNDTDEPLAYASALNNVGAILWAQAKFSEARAYTARSLALHQETLGESHPNIGTLLSNLCVQSNTLGDYERAAGECARALPNRIAALGESHPGVASVLHTMGAISAARGHIEVAERHHRRSLQIRETALGADHPHVARSLSELASLAILQKRYDEATDLLDRALRIRKQAFGDTHPRVAHLLVQQGDLLRLQDQSDAALRRFESAQQILEKSLGKQHPEVAAPLANIGRLWQARGQCERALPYFERAKDSWLAALGDQHPVVATPLSGLGECLVELSRHEEAIGYLRHALAIRATEPTDPASTAESQLALSRALWTLHAARVEARELARAAQDAFVKLGAQDRVKVVETWLRTLASD